MSHMRTDLSSDKRACLICAKLWTAREGRTSFLSNTNCLGGRILICNMPVMCHMRATSVKCMCNKSICAESSHANLFKSFICAAVLRPRQGDVGETGRKRKNGYARGMRQRRKKHSRPSLEFVQDEDSRPKHRNQNIRECSKLAPDKRGCQKLGICIG